MRNPSWWKAVWLAAAGVLIAADPILAAEHTLMPSPRTVHIGNFNATNRPVLTINSGDFVTLEAATQIEPEAIDASGVVAPSVVRRDISRPSRLRQRGLRREDEHLARDDHGHPRREHETGGWLPAAGPDHRKQGARRAGDGEGQQLRGAPASLTHRVGRGR